MQKKDYSIEIGGKTLTLSKTSLAHQANSAILAQYGETVVLATVVMSGQDSKLDYLPLKVDYEERFYAAGKIIGSRFIRREGRASDEAILAGRLVDRTIRPLFDYRIRRDMQVVCTVLAYDEKNDPDFVGLIAASAALALSDVPWNGPVAGVRIAKKGEEFLINPETPLWEECDFETFASGPKDKINMIELAGKEISEEDAIKAYELAMAEINRLIDFQEKMVAEIGLPKVEISFADETELGGLIRNAVEGKLESALYQNDKKERNAALATLQGDVFKALTEKLTAEGKEFNTGLAERIWEDLLDETVHKNILENGRRPDGRGVDEIRQLSAEIGILPRTHGSSLFMRGDTQSLAVTTLAAPGQEQLVETMESTLKRRFMLHYNFPPYSVGETGNFRGPGRREIGHGTLARKAIEPLMPSQEEFPYTVRVVSEIMSSNGSSSMATVCASSLSLMDAGVPLKKQVAGIAMGLMTSSDGKFSVLTDLQGQEDFYGDMDFKVAGTRDGITAIQLDVKIKGLTMEIIKATLEKAKIARMKILDVLDATIPSARKELSPYAPAIEQLSINPDKIGMVIGPGGKNINGLIRKYSLATIDIEEDGRVFVSGTDRKAVDLAVEEIRLMTRELKQGDIIEGQVIKILDFGAIVDIGGGQDGMIHVSELKSGFVKAVTDVLKMGDFVRAKVVRVEDNGKIALSLKALSPTDDAPQQ
jgi:polyribonucleotide nucleotidyltransferase